MKIPYVLVLYSFLFYACSHNVTTSISQSYPTLDYRQNVLVIDEGESVPVHSELLGFVKLGDTGFSTHCNYELAVDKAKLEARKIGGNAIRIVDHRTPSFFTSSCHRITAEILKVKGLNKSWISKNNISNSSNDEFATLSIYRFDGGGVWLSYDVFLDDSLICTVGNRFRTKVKLKTEGNYSLWLNTEHKTEIPLNIEFGKEYFVRTSMLMNKFNGQPELKIVDSESGKSEYLTATKENKKMDTIVRSNGMRVNCNVLNIDSTNVYFLMRLDDKEMETHLKREQIENIIYAK